MRFGSAGSLGIALSVLTALVASPPPARAATVQVDLTIKFIPPDPITPSGPPIFQDLTGGAFFVIVIPGSEPPTGFSAGPGSAFDIGTLIPPSPIFTGHFYPSDPCVGGGTCQLGFAFGGQTTALNADGVSHSLFPAFAFKLLTDAPNASPQGPPIIPIDLFVPQGPPIKQAGIIVAYDAPVQIGTWEVTISETPLPAALPLFASGLGALSLFGWRRKRRQAA